VVVNLSSKPLNSAKSSLLSKSLNFCRNQSSVEGCSSLVLSKSENIFSKPFFWYEASSNRSFKSRVEHSNKLYPNVGKGCSFWRELDEDLDQFSRRLRIEEYFHSKRETSEDLSTDELDIKEVIDIPRFVKKSNWIRNDDLAEFRGLLERLTTTLDFYFRLSFSFWNVVYASSSPLCPLWNQLEFYQIPNTMLTCMSPRPTT
jgi:hypothetical protein